MCVDRHDTCSSSTEDFASFNTFEEVGTAPQTTQDSEAADKQVITESVMSSIITEPVTIATTPSNSIPTRKSSRSLNFMDILDQHIAFLANVFKIKYKANGTTDNYKGSYHEGFDSLATTKGWPLHQLDINNAFLHGFIDEDIYMQPPTGYNGASTGQDEFTAVLVYVDDILITGNCETKISSTKMALDQKFTIKDLGGLILHRLRDMQNRSG
ncbi:retrovirus-related pol polyprotein from transposon TNT 1-94, partial [Tanacetum coccineum]